MTLPDLEKLLQDPPKEYRPLPFWSWNEKLDVETSAQQIAMMDEAGLGGYFMHARGGLQTPYMGKEWMDNIRCGIDEGKKRGMSAWGYDEDGWPSGFGAGAVNGMGERYQQKYLRCEITDAPQQTPRTVANLPHGEQTLHLYYEVNPFYVDTMDKAVIAEFLHAVHERYERELGHEEFSAMGGLFTDEPQVSRSGIPWSLILPDEYRARYGEELLPQLDGLFFDTPHSAHVRFRFWQTVRDLFTDAYMHQIYDWCQAHGTKLTGHMVLEESMESQLTSNGACMPSYAYMDIPGMDWLGRSVGPSTTPVQLSSVAAQTGKNTVISETFALCGWDVSFEELKWIAEWQMVRGINLICQHLEGYSLRGIRKRDYPATLFYQQPWWDEYKALNDYFARIGLLLRTGDIRYGTLVIHPMSSGWLCFDNAHNCGLHDLDERFDRLLSALDDAQVPYHLGDERILREHGTVQGDALTVGRQSYRTVIVPDTLTLSAETVELLERYRAAGGELLFADRIPQLIDGEPDPRIAALAAGCPCHADPAALAAAVPQRERPLRLTGNTGRVASTERYFDDRTMIYIVNSAEEARTFTAAFAGRSAARMDDATGKLVPLPYTVQDGTLNVPITLPAMGSVVLFAFPDDRFSPAAPAAALRPLAFDPAEPWTIAAVDENALVLDYCDYAFDGQPVGTHRHINNIQEEACALGRPVDVDMTFRFTVGEIPDGPVWLVAETPQIFTFTLNGHPIANVPDGRYRDRSFCRLPVTGRLIEGENVLTMSVHFAQSEQVYQNLRDALVFESQKNLLSYDMEIEAVYLIGQFGVATPGAFTPLERRATRYDGSFTVTRRPDAVLPGDIVPQGFPFFAGRMTVKKTVTLSADDCTGRCLRFAERCDTVTRVRVNGRDAGAVLWRPYELPLDGLLHEGENTVEIEMVGNLRDLLGPHHLKSGESYTVGPFSFFEESPLWCGGHNADWDDRYCFVRHGLAL